MRHECCLVFTPFVEFLSIDVDVKKTTNRAVRRSMAVTGFEGEWAQVASAIQPKSPSKRVENPETTNTSSSVL